MLEKELIKQEVRGSDLRESLNKRKLDSCVKSKGFSKHKKIKPKTTLVRQKFPLLNCEDLMSQRKPLKKRKGLKVAVVFSGGPASGGHNVLVGLFESLKGNVLYGIRNGPQGLLDNDLFVIKSTKNIVNTGGFDFLGTGRKKIKSYEEMEKVRQTCLKRKLDAVVIIGGDDSNTNATILAEYLHADGIQVIGVPKTIDGDLQIDKYLPVPFGFDTATKIFSSLVGNLCNDTISSRKYWHFVRLMGRDASHVTLEVALQTKSTHAIISEEVAEKKKSLHEVVEEIARLVLTRKNSGRDYGVVLIPEGLLEFIPELKGMLDNIRQIVEEKHKYIQHKNPKRRRKYVARRLSDKNSKIYSELPENVQEMLTLSRDSHGNVRVSQIPTEELISMMVAERLKVLDVKYDFQPVLHFYGYEGRCGPPTLFDAKLGYNLGLAAGYMIHSGLTGYMVGMTDFNKGGKAYAIPLCALMNVEMRHGESIWVIEKSKVKMKDPAFKFFSSRRKTWQTDDCFTYPGPRQLSGKTKIPLITALNNRYKNDEWN